MENLIKRFESIAKRIEGTNQPSQLVSVRKAAEFVGVSKRTLMSWIKRFNIPYIQVPSGTILINLSILNDWLQSHAKVKNKKVNIGDENLSDCEKQIVEEILENLL